MQVQPQTVPSYVLPNKEALITQLTDEINGKIDFSRFCHTGRRKEDHDYELKTQAITKLYGKLPRVYPCIFVVTWQTSDGGGDISNALKTADILLREFPNSHLLILVPNGVWKKTQDLCPEHLKKVLYEYTAALLQAIDKIHQRLRDKKLKEKIILQTGKRMLQEESLEKIFDETKRSYLPVIHYEVATPVGAHIQFPNSSYDFHIDEYNGWRIQESHGDVCDNDCSWFTGGVGFLEDHATVGMHLDPQLDPGEELENRRDLLALLEDEELKNELHRYPSAKLYFAYHSDGSDDSLLHFIETINHCSKARFLEFVLVTKTSNAIFDRLIPRFSQNRQFHSVKKSLGDRRLRTLKLSGKELKLRFVAVASVIHGDMITLMQSSERMMHVSGDQTLVEALSMRGRIPFYQLQSWKNNMVDELIHLAKYLTGEESTLHKFLQSWFTHSPKMEETDMEELGEQFTLLQDKLREWYTIDDWLVGSANQVLMKHHHKELQSFEKHLHSKSFGGRTLTALFNRAINCIEQHSDFDLKRRRV